jgi:hypothetical protein
VIAMLYAVAALVALPFVALLVAMVRGRARVRSCCAADPAKDLRMRGAFSEDAH